MQDPRRYIGLDFETYGAVSLPDHGLERYVSDSSFRPLIASLSRKGISFFHGETIDFTLHFGEAVAQLREKLGDKIIVAHNAPFEQRVLRSIGIDIPSSRFVDSAVVARAAGAAGKLEAAAPQLLDIDKMEDGRRLIQLFSIPGKYQELSESKHFDQRIIMDHELDWKKFIQYCELDAHLGLRIALSYLPWLSDRELENQAVTMDMNAIGWHVDVPLVEEMQRRYLENVAEVVRKFRDELDEPDLNFNSLPQLKAWCAERGIKATSFDEKNVAKLHKRISTRLDKADAGERELDFVKYEQYSQVLALLETKQVLGGSSLKKLKVILDTTGADGRLRDQYLHIGAGQSYRTTGRSVQMQNLKRLIEPADMDELFDDECDVEWDNDRLAANLRQVFTSSDPNGQLIVGDFSSVESRGLAWLAGARKKLRAYADGLDLYKVQAQAIFGVAYGDVTKDQRQTGKVGELSCGYGAGGGAVQSFAAGMGVELTEGEANKLVVDWREANPEVVWLWGELDRMLFEVTEERQGVALTKVGPNQDYTLYLERIPAPASLVKQHSTAYSLRLLLVDPYEEEVLSRYFHGVHRRGRDVCYYKPSERKTGDLWSPEFTDPKTKQVRRYTIYGGKLTGILTQSLCREIFFNSLRRVHRWVSELDNVDLIGQFHDEIVLDWRPGANSLALDLDDVVAGIHSMMSDAGDILDFPLEADIKHAYRYIK